MKFKIFFILILLACFIAMLSSSIAQTRDYIPMLNQGAVWFETYTNYTWPPSPYGYSFCGRKYLDGDTFIDDKMYSKIYHEELDIYCTEQILSGPEYYGAIREDIQEQKVWYYPPNSPFEFLYFDFSLSTGDTVVWGSWFNSGQYMYLTVSGIDTITTIDGVDRRRWLFDEDLYSEESSMIEGVGCSSGLLASYEVIFEYWNNLVKLSIDTTLTYCCNYNECGIPTDSCTTVRVKSFYNMPKIYIYPNPVIAGNPLRISGFQYPRNEPVHVEFYNILGNKVESYTSTTTDLIIASPHTPGLYVFNIYNSTFKTQIKILVKQ
jgi:hypothetical protein